MGGPSGMGYTYRTTTILLLSDLLQGSNLAFGLIYGYLLLAIAQQGNASRVVSAVFKPVKARNQYRVSPTRSYISYYSTHKNVLFTRSMSKAMHLSFIVPRTYLQLRH